MRGSLRPWLAAMWRHAYLLIGGAALSAALAIAAFAHTDLPLLPSWAWVVLAVVLLFATSFRVFHEVYSTNLQLISANDASTVIGMLSVEPDMVGGHVDDSDGYTVELRPLLRFYNQATRALIVKLDHLHSEVGDSENVAKSAVADLRAATIAPGKYLEWPSQFVSVKPGETVIVRMEYAAVYGVPMGASVVRIAGAYMGEFEVKAPARVVRRSWLIENEAPPVTEAVDPKVGLWTALDASPEADG